jgi:hypothetical protein
LGSPIFPRPTQRKVCSAIIVGLEKILNRIFAPESSYAFSATGRRKSGPTGSLTAGEERLLDALATLREIIL